MVASLIKSFKKAESQIKRITGLHRSKNQRNPLIRLIGDSEFSGRDLEENVRVCRYSHQ